MYERKIDHGVLIVATGGNEYKPLEYLYGEDHRVLTQIELGKRLYDRGADDLKHVVMIQCVGSRNDDYPNCSRVCCQSAVKNALHIKELNPAPRSTFSTATFGPTVNWSITTVKQDANGSISSAFNRMSLPRLPSAAERTQSDFQGSGASERSDESLRTF